MVQLLFARLPQFKDDTNSSKQVKDLTTKNHQRIHEQINTTGEINFFFLIEVIPGFRCNTGDDFPGGE